MTTLNKKLQTLQKILKEKNSFYEFKAGETGQALLIFDTLIKKSNWIYYNKKEYKIYTQTAEPHKFIFTTVNGIADFITNNGIYGI